MSKSVYFVLERLAEQYKSARFHIASPSKWYEKDNFLHFWVKLWDKEKSFDNNVSMIS